MNNSFESSGNEEEPNVSAGDKQDAKALDNSFESSDMKNWMLKELLKSVVLKYVIFELVIACLSTI